mgnify:CR=1 FL=1
MSVRIKELREAAHMTQVRLSIELEVSQETISAYESGKHYPSVASLLKLSEIFSASCDYILGLSDIRCPAASDSLSPEDTRLLAGFHALDAHKKELLLSYLEGLSAR